MSNQIRRLTLTAACAASFLLSFAAPPALATHFQPESYAELLAQLRHREVVALVLHPQGYKAHASLSNGGHVTVAYTPAQVPALRTAAGAGGASFAIATARAKPKAAVHHKLRYIAGGVLIVVIVVVLVVLLLGRRRALEEEGRSGGDEAASAPPPAGSG
jgi:hypothetical protein